MGRSYVIDHCVAALKEEKEKKDFQMYVSECLRIITENTAHLGEGCSYISLSLHDLVKPKEEADTRTAEEIISTIMADLGEKEVEADECI